MPEDNEKPIEPDYQNLEVNEPYLGPWWAVMMLVIYLIKRNFPPEPGSLWYWILVYVITLVTVVTLFTAYKRIKFTRWQKNRKKQSDS